jgi:hypothetical protein
MTNKTLFDILVAFETGPVSFDEESIGEWIWGLYRTFAIDSEAFQMLMNTPTWVFERYYSA